jgi:hypothetical protein
MATGGYKELLSSSSLSKDPKGRRRERVQEVTMRPCPAESLASSLKINHGRLRLQ